MLIESDDVRECISRIFTEVHNSDKSFKVYSEINNILFRLSDDISAIETEQARIYRYVERPRKSEITDARRAQC